jgi:Mn-dependent DtxR family transcriptional regulator
MPRRSQHAKTTFDEGDAPWRAKPVPSPPPCAEVSSREAGYLLALHALERTAAQATQVALARAMNVSAPSALEMIRRLRALGLVEPDRLAPTNGGTSAALLLASRRHAAQLLTHDILGIDTDDAEPEVERLAANLSPALARRLLARPDRRRLPGNPDAGARSAEPRQ